MSKRRNETLRWLCVSQTMRELRKHYDTLSGELKGIVDEYSKWRDDTYIEHPPPPVPTHIAIEFDESPPNNEPWKRVSINTCASQYPLVLGMELGGHYEHSTHYYNVWYQLKDNDNAKGNKA